MASQKLPIKDILAAIDMNAKSVWKELSDEEKNDLKNDLQKKIHDSNERIKDSNIGDIINKQFDIFTN